MIVKFHYYQDKERVLRTNGGKLTYRGQQVILYSDYSAIVNQKRAALNPVKALFYQKKVKFGLLFLAVLRVHQDGETHHFDTAAKAQQFYDKHIHNGSSDS